MLILPGKTASWNANTFHPSDLFTSGRDGFAILPSITTSFESADNSDPAEVADGVQFQEDSSGLGSPNNFSQGIIGERPTLQQNGSTYVLRFVPGSPNQTMEYGSTKSWIDGTNGVSLFARIYPNDITLATSYQIIGSDPTTPAASRLFQFRYNGNGTVALTGFNSTGTVNWTATTTTAMTVSNWYNVCAILNPTNLRIWITDMGDADVEATVTNTSGTVNTTARDMYLGTRNSALANPLHADMAFAFLGNWSLSEAERNDLATFASAL